MPSQLPKHPAYLVRDILLRDWNPSNTAGLDPNVPPKQDGGLSLTREWYSTVDWDPHIALTNFGEDVGSTSRYTSQTAGRPAQLRQGVGMATAFAEGEHSYGDGGVTAESITDDIRSEIERILGDAMADRRLPGPIESMASTWDSEGVDRDPVPPVWQQQISIYYFWNKTT